MSAEPLRRFRFAPILTATVLTVLLIWLVGTVAHVLILLFIGALIALYLGALAEWIERRFRWRDRLALPIAIVLTLAAIVALLYILVPPVIAQTETLIRGLPNDIQQWDSAIDNVARRNPVLAAVYQPGQHKLFIDIYNQITATVGNVYTRAFSFVHAAIYIFSVLVMAIYLSLHPALYREWVIALFPPLHRDLVRDVLGDLADTLRAYIAGQLLTMTVLALLTTIGLWLLGVPYYVSFGVFTGLSSIVPFFGSLLSTLLPALFVLNGPGGSTRAMLVIGLGIVIHIIEGNLVSPMVMSKQVDLPPVLTIVGVLVIGELLGGAGLLVAVPTIAAVMVLVRRILITRIYEGQGFRKTPRDRPMVLRVPAPGGGVLVPPGPHIDVLAHAERRDRPSGGQHPGA